MGGRRGVRGFRVVTIAVPEALARRLEDLGIDVEATVADLLLNSLSLDPEDEAEARTELARRYLEEGKSLADRDPVQASEKLYKAAEEAVKALALRRRLKDILARVRERGRWTVTDLSKAALRLSEVMGRWILDSWDHAWALHVWGFHEAKLDVEDVKARLLYIERLVRQAEEEVHGAGGTGS